MSPDKRTEGDRGRGLRRLVYGIDEGDLPLGERARWEWAAASVIVASTLSALGLGDLILLSTGSWSIAILVTGLCVVAIFQFDRALTRPKSDYSVVDIPGVVEDDSAGKVLAMRLALCAVTTVLGTIGLALIANDGQLDADMAERAQTHQLEVMQDRMVNYFDTVTSQRDAVIGRICGAGSFQLLAMAEARRFNTEAIIPAKQLLAGSHAMDRMVEGPIPPDDIARAGSVDVGCPQAEQVIGEDPLLPLWKRLHTDRVGASLPRVVVGPSVGDVAAYDDAVSGALAAAKQDRTLAADAVTDAPDDLRLRFQVKELDAIQRVETLQRLDLFTSRWSAELDTELKEPKVTTRVGLLWSHYAASLLLCFAAVAFFDFGPMLAAFFARNRRGGDTVETRHAKREAEALAFRDRLLVQTLDEIAKLAPSPSIAAGVKAEAEVVARSFRGPDVVPAHPRRSGLRRPYPDEPPLSPPAPEAAWTRRAVLLGGAGAVGVAGVWGWPRIFAVLAVEEAPTVGATLLREFSANFGLTAATDALERLTGFSPQSVVDLVFPPEVKASDLRPDYRPDELGRQMYSTYLGGALVGIGSTTGRSIYPGFVPPQVASRTGPITPEDTLLLPPHWLNVIAATGDQLLTAPAVGGAEASAVLFPQTWRGPAPKMPTGQTGSRRMLATWESGLASVSVDLVVSGTTRPAMGDLRRGPVIDVATGTGEVAIEIRPSMSAPLSPEGILELQRLIPSRLSLADIPIPVVWR